MKYTIALLIALLQLTDLVEVGLIGIGIVVLEDIGRLPHIEHSRDHLDFEEGFRGAIVLGAGAADAHDGEVAAFQEAVVVESGGGLFDGLGDVAADEGHDLVFVVDQLVFLPSTKNNRLDCYYY